MYQGSHFLENTLPSPLIINFSTSPYLSKTHCLENYFGNPGFKKFPSNIFITGIFLEGLMFH